jgi:hypothetical protein
MHDGPDIIIMRPLSESECRYIESLNHVSVFSSVKINLKNYTFIDEINKKSGRYIQEIFDEISVFGHKKSDVQGIEWTQLLSFKNQSYWYYIRFTLFTKYYPQILENKILHELSSRLTEKRELLVYSNFEHDIQATYHTQDRITGKGSHFNIFPFGVIFLIRLVIGFFLTFRKCKNKHVLFLEPYNLQKVLDISSKGSDRFILSDYYNEYLSDKCLHQNDFVFVSDFYFPKGISFSSIRKQFFINKYTSKSIYFEYHFAIAFLNPIFLLEIFRFRSCLKNSISKEHGSNFSNKLLIGGIKSSLNLLTLMYARECVFEKLAGRYCFRSVTCHHEQVYHHLSFIHGAKKSKVPTIGFQHGIIHPLHMHYMYTAEDVKFDPFPDYMITWGDYWKNILVNKSSYPESRVVSLGQIRTDIIPDLIKQNIVNDKLRVLYASQPHHRPDVRDRITAELLLFFSNRTECEFFIKPHPGEKDAHVYFHQIAKSLHLQTPVLNFDDLYLSLNSCDLLITHNSTVTAEAIYFKKPVILYDFEDSDLSGFSRFKGAVFTADSPGKLDEMITGLLNKTLPVDEAVQDDFIRQFCFAIDGNTCQRYIDFIREIAK